MSTTAVKEFYNYVLTKPELQSKINEVSQKNDKEEYVNLAVKLGQENGYNFNAADVESAIYEAINPSEELSDEQLEAVAGGTGKPDMGSSVGAGFNLFGPFIDTVTAIGSPTGDSSTPPTT
jgi:predicted ribosomally synthesized peptide with nif11-like leader